MGQLLVLCCSGDRQWVTLGLFDCAQVKLLMRSNACQWGYLILDSFCAVPFPQSARMKLYNLGCVDLFRCVFCRNLAKQPKIMSCMHTACYECLRKHFEPESSQIRCNACDAVNTVKNVSKFINSIIVFDYIINKKPQISCLENTKDYLSLRPIIPKISYVVFFRSSGLG